jgi:hypothetical protein
MNDEIRMSNDKIKPNGWDTRCVVLQSQNSSFEFRHSFDIRH